MNKDEFECLIGVDDDGTIGIDCGRFRDGCRESLIQIEGRSLLEVMQTLETAAAEAERTVLDLRLHWGDL